jgi:thiol:disulfide interchange protein DsbD
MGFMMLFVVIWLTWVFVAQSDSSTVLPLLIGFLLISFGAWSYGKLTQGFKKLITKALLLTMTLISTGSGFYYILEAGRTSMLVESSGSKKMIDSGWEKFSLAAVEQLRAEGKGVFIDFTAKWCLLCQANLLILNMPEVEQRMEKMGVVKMMADWTKSDPEITQALAQFGRNSVPLYIYYPPGKNSKPQVLPQVLTQDLMLGILEGNNLGDIAESH